MLFQCPILLYVYYGAASIGVFYFNNLDVTTV